MILILLIVATLTISYAALGRPLAVWIPALGPFPFYQGHRFRQVLTVASWSLLVAALILSPSAGVIVWASLLFLLSIIPFALMAEKVFKTLTRTEHVAAADATWADDERVAGVEIGGQAVAYNMERMVIPRHLIADRVDGQHLLISFCALCASAVVYQSEVRGISRVFHVAGVWRRNMVVVDNHTGTLWQQGTGEALLGPEKGMRLPMVASQQMTWGAWKARHPNTQAVIDAADAEQPVFSLEFMSKMLRKTKSIPIPGSTRLGSELDGVADVFGIEVDHHARAYPLAALQGQDRTFEESLGEVKVKLSYDDATQTLAAERLDTGAALLVERHWWRGWKEFHPQSDVGKPQLEPSLI